MRRTFLLLFILSVTGPRAADPADLCVEAEAGPARTRCLESVLLAEEPASASTLGSRERDRLRAELLDLRGQALGKLGRSEEAAEALRASLALDDGTNRLVWLDDGGRAVWTAALDVGLGRQERGARALLAAGKADAARALLAHVLASGGDGPTLEAWTQTGGGVVPGLDPGPTELSAMPWYPRLPDMEVRLLEGTPYPLAAARGSVLLIDFWASWCAPCVHELPRLQALAEELRAAGLVVLTVNARETADAARAAARALNLTLPIGFYDDALDRALKVRSLPTILLVDRGGRIRNRWDAFVPDFDGEVAAKARALLDEKPDANRRKVAVVQAGAGLFDVRFTREIANPIVGIAVVPEEAGGARLAAATLDQLLLLGASGAIDRRQKLPAGTSGRLRSVAVRGPARYDLVSFRPGRPELAWVDSRGGAVHAQTVASPVLDAAHLPGGAPEPGQPGDGRLVLATIAGVSVTGPDGPETQWSEVAGEARAAASQGSGAAAGTWTLDAQGRLRWLDAAGHVVREAEVERSARKLIVADGVPGVGLLPRSVRAAVVGRFLPGARSQAATATDDGQLVLVDLATGSIPFRARWTGIDDLASGDLDGDGRDELVVAAERTLTVLGAAPGTPAAVPAARVR